MVIGFAFTIMLLPQLYDAYRGAAKLNFWTCLVTGLGCIAIGGIDMTLNLPLAAIVSATTGLMWLALMYYSEENRKNPKCPAQYINSRALDMPVRDQGERNTSAGMSAASGMGWHHKKDWNKKKEE